jgi:hypothetical protein
MERGIRRVYAGANMQKIQTESNISSLYKVNRGASQPFQKYE